MTDGYGSPQDSSHARHHLAGDPYCLTQFGDLPDLSPRDVLDSDNHLFCISLPDHLFEIRDTVEDLHSMDAAADLIRVIVHDTHYLVREILFPFDAAQDHFSHIPCPHD